jgi:putative transposase
MATFSLRGPSVPNDEAAKKLLHLVLKHASDSWKTPPQEWFEAMAQFAVIFADRFQA